MQKWEYLFLHIVGQEYAINRGKFTAFKQGENIWTVTDKLRKEGWELMLKDCEEILNASGTWVFKRPIQSWFAK